MKKKIVNYYKNAIWSSSVLHNSDVLERSIIKKYTIL